MALQLTVLGCDGSYPGPGGACSGYLVESPATGVGSRPTRVWLDAGPGTLGNLQRHVGFGDVDAIVLTHSHPDHWTDVLAFRVVCTYVAERWGVPVYSTAETLRLAKEFSDVVPAFDWAVIADGDVVDIGPMRFRFSRTDHPPETLAARIDAGDATLAYTADTGPEWRLTELGDGIDLALCEATYLSDHEGGDGHLNARQAGTMAAEAGAAGLLLTHLWPMIDPDRAVAEAAETFGGPIRVAAPNERYDV
jgi:ribonuclease BN (tRNA processing enzyme)